MYTSSAASGHQRPTDKNNFSRKGAMKNTDVIIIFLRLCVFARIIFIITDRGKRVDKRVPGYENQPNHLAGSCPSMSG